MRPTMRFPKPPTFKAAAMLAAEALLALIVVGLLAATWMPAIWSAGRDDEFRGRRPGRGGPPWGQRDRR